VGPFASPFVECSNRHSAKAPSLPSSCSTSAQRKWPPLSVPLLSALGGTWQMVLLLLSVGTTTLGKEALSVPRCAFFSECYGHVTRLKETVTPKRGCELGLLKILSKLGHNLIPKTKPIQINNLECETRFCLSIAIPTTKPKFQS
jgi:hypothetical protein